MTELKARYETEVSPVTRRIHSLIASVYGDTALMFDTPEQAEFFSPNASTPVCVKYWHGLEILEVHKANDMGMPIGGCHVTIGKYMVADIFTIRRLEAALEVVR